MEFSRSDSARIYSGHSFSCLLARLLECSAHQVKVSRKVLRWRYQACRLALGFLRLRNRVQQPGCQGGKAFSSCQLPSTSLQKRPGFLFFFLSPFLVLELQGHLSNTSVTTMGLCCASLSRSAIVGKGERTAATRELPVTIFMQPAGALFCFQWRMQRPDKGKIKLLCVKIQPSTISFSAVLCQRQTHPRHPRAQDVIQNIHTLR